MQGFVKIFDEAVPKSDIFLFGFSFGLDSVMLTAMRDHGDSAHNGFLKTRRHTWL